MNIVSVTALLRPTIALATLALVFQAGIASAQFEPATGPIGELVDFSPLNDGAQLTSERLDPLTGDPTGEFFTVRRNNNSITIERPDPALDDLVYPLTFTVPDQINVAFLNNSALIKGQSPFTTNDAATDRLDADLVPMNAPTLEVTEILSYSQQHIIHPSGSFNTSEDQKVLFTRYFIDVEPVANAHEIRVWRTADGLHLCSMGTPGGRTTGGLGLDARVLDPSNDSADIGTATAIKKHAQPVEDKICLFPSARLSRNVFDHDFGTVANTVTPSEPITFSETGGAPADIIDFTLLSDPNSTDFALVPPPGMNFPFTVAADSEVIASIQFNPSNLPGQTRDIDDTLQIFTETGSFFIEVEGTSRDPAPQLVLDPDSINFGIVNVGETRTEAFTVSNPGELDLTFLSMNAPGLPYSVLPGQNPPAVILAGEEREFEVTFTPVAEVTSPDSIVFVSDPPFSLTETLNLTGTGHIPVAEFSLLDDDDLDYGPVEVGYRFGRGVTVQNTGDLALEFDLRVDGDASFTVGTNVAQPGPGVQGPISFRDNDPDQDHNALPPTGRRIFRVTFDATLPADDVVRNATLVFENTNDQNIQGPIEIDLEGAVITGRSLDTVLVLDRSGSMEEEIADVRRAAILFVNLLRPNVGDRAAVIEYNEESNAIKEMTPIDDASLVLFRNELNDDDHLVADGATSIAAGVLAAIDELDDTERDIRAIVIVSDGNDNTPAVLVEGNIEVELNEVVVPEGITVHGMGLGLAADVNLATLESISEATGGSTGHTGSVIGRNVFDVEKFFLQAAFMAMDMEQLLDPVATISPGETHPYVIELIPADKEVVFTLMFERGTLPYTIIAPDGTEYPATSPPDGFGVMARDLPHARILRLQLPHEEPERYEGPWTFQIRHQGFTLVSDGKSVKTVRTGDPVRYAYAVSVGSNLRMLGLLSPEVKFSGDPIQVNATLSEEGIPVLGAEIQVTTTMPDGSQGPVFELFDNGSNNDGEAKDGEYGALFKATDLVGGYSFHFHATGKSAREGNFVREVQLGKTVLKQGTEVPDLVPPGGFKDVAPDAGVAGTRSSRGVAWGDANDDGMLDLFVANTKTANLYYNNGDGTFKDVAASFDLDRGGWGAAWGDYDLMAGLDLIYARDADHSLLFRSEGGGALANRNSAAGLQKPLGRTPAWADVDNDGLLDFYLAGQSSNQLYRNKGGGVFAEVGAAAGVADKAASSGIAWGDYDDDGDQDLYVANEDDVNRLFRNEGNGAFKEVGNAAGVNDKLSGSGVAWGDFDNDLDLDLYVGNLNGPNRLYRNDGKGVFKEVSAAAKVNDKSPSKGVAWADYDGDGDLDLYVVNERSANRLYRNNGNGTFTDQAVATGVADAGSSGHGTAWGDFDNDFDPDLYVANAGANRLFRNEAGANHWLTVQLIGTAGNPTSVGASVTVQVGNARQRRDVDGGSGLRSQPGQDLIFGLGSDSKVDLLVARWPSGAELRLKNVSADQRLTLKEPRDR